MDSKVLDSRPTDEGAAIRRRRECMSCAGRFTTYEKLEQTPLLVVKKDGSRETFQPRKILEGLITAAEKRPVGIDELESIVNEVERTLRNQPEREIQSVAIGELVMERLRLVDEVAYVRFASVYRQFKDIQRFKEELERLLSSDGPRSLQEARDSLDDTRGRT